MSNVFDLFDKAKTIINDEKQSRTIKYEIAGVVDNYEGSDKVHVKVQVKGTSKLFVKSVQELYEKIWLEDFSKEDVAYIGFLYATEANKNLLIIESFPRRKTTLTKSVVILAMVFICFLIVSNLTAFKIAEIHIQSFLFIKLSQPLTINFPAALVFFPLTYFFDDVLTEVYGFKTSRLIIWGGLICNTIFSLCTWATVYLPVSEVWNNNTHQGAIAYKLIFSGTLKIFFASAIGYFVGEFLNSIILSKLKVLTSGKYLFLRVIGSTSIGVGVDSAIFCFLAFIGTLPNDMIVKIIMTQYIFKLSYEMLMLPFTYFLTAWLKKIDNVDYYDFHTKFNPFSLSLEDRKISSS